MTAIIYTRVSTAEQVDNLSLDMQERACSDFCAAEGLAVDRVYREEGQSAKTANRTELLKLMDYCTREGKRRGITVLVVYKVDRLARHAHDHLAIKATLRQHGIQLRAVAEAFDDSPVGNFVETVMAANAQLDNELRRDRTIDGMKEALRRGR